MERAMKYTGRWLLGLALASGVLARGAAAETVPVAPEAAAPQLRAATESAPVTLRDNRHATVTLRVPLALHRGANAFRLYGPRPLTLHDRNRRRDLYRDTFLELATRSRLAPNANAWD